MNIHLHLWYEMLSQASQFQYCEQFSFSVAEKCASMGSCIVFMPRIDLWAVETPNQVTEDSDADLSNHQCPENEKHQHPENEKSYFARGLEESVSLSQQCKSEEMLECQDDVAQSASHAWNLFVEQVESLSVSASLMILVGCYCFFHFFCWFVFFVSFYHTILELL